jgi:hypothetical protein
VAFRASRTPWRLEASSLNQPCLWASWLVGRTAQREDRLKRVRAPFANVRKHFRATRSVFIIVSTVDTRNVNSVPTFAAPEVLQEAECPARVLVGHWVRHTNQC